LLDKRSTPHYDPRVTDLDLKRTDRVAQLLRQELADVIDRELKDPRVGFVTVTEVRSSADLRSARVFVSVYGGEKEQATSLQGLQAASGFLKRELGRRMRLRRVPDLTFELDRGLDRARRLDDLIEAAERGDTEAPPERAEEFGKVRTGRSELADTARVFRKGQAADGDGGPGARLRRGRGGGATRSRRMSKGKRR
jgi:ribosome-binding factor A